MRKWSPDVVEILHPIYSLLELDGRRNILDIGCGNGYDLWQISKLSPQKCHFWGIDSSSKAIQTAQADSLFDERFEFRVRDVSQGLPFDDGQFDVVYSKNVLECIPDKSALLTETHRVLQDEGQILFAHYDWDSQSIDGDNKAFIREMVHRFGDWRQDWMAVSDAWMGRRLWTTINGSDLFEGQVKAYVLTNTEFCSPYYGYERINDFRSMVERGLIDKEEFERFYQEMEARSRRGTYFYSITMYVYFGHKKKKGISSCRP